MIDQVPDSEVISCAEVGKIALTSLFRRYHLRLHWLSPGLSIPGSHWGDSEAGLLGNCLIVRADTPLHSALHEACHYVCMDEPRRHVLHTDAGGNDAEENAVCYLQLLLADYFEDVGRERLCLDMDRWGYSFRLGSAAAWFTQDAGDACRWLLKYDLIDVQQNPTWQLRIH